MPRQSPYTIDLSNAEERELPRRAAQYTAPYREVVRARIVLMVAEGLQNKEIAERLSLPVQIVTKWRKRFHAERLAGLDERRRIGRPPTTIVTDAPNRPESDSQRAKCAHPRHRYSTKIDEEPEHQAGVLPTGLVGGSPAMADRACHTRLSGREERDQGTDSDRDGTGSVAMAAAWWVLASL